MFFILFRFHYLSQRIFCCCWWWWCCSLYPTLFVSGTSMRWLVCVCPFAHLPICQNVFIIFHLSKLSKDDHFFWNGFLAKETAVKKSQRFGLDFFSLRTSWEMPANEMSREEAHRCYCVIYILYIDAVMHLLLRCQYAWKIFYKLTKFSWPFIHD